MKNIKIVIGSMYGDEGKGFTVDYLCSNLKNKGSGLAVRHNSTAQAGHTVERNGIRHVFKTFGAGMLQNHIYTLLASTFVVEPIHLIIEAEKLAEIFKVDVSDMLNLLYIDLDCKVILPWDRMLNEKIERERQLTSVNHGSCGYGLFESIIRGQEYRHFTIEDLYQSYLQGELLTLLREIQHNHYYTSKLDNVYGEELIQNFKMDLEKIFDSCNIVNEANIMNKFNNLVFEGAQGLMLDWDRNEFMPHLTASKTNSENVEMLLNKINGEKDIEIIYVTRTYHTRHGKGYMQHEVSCAKDLGFDLFDETNQPNEFQETLRYGYFDLKNFSNNVTMDYNRFAESYPETKLGIMMTHSKLTDGSVLFPNEKIPMLKFKELLKFKVDNFYVGDLDRVVKI